MIEASVELEIPFHDVDMLRVTWHGNYVRYLEVARCALLDRIGYGYMEMEKSGFAWPVVDMRLRYAKPCRFGDRIRVTARIVETEFRLRIDYQIHNADTGERLTKATTVQVALEVATGELCYPTPAILQQRIAACGATDCA